MTQERQLNCGMEEERRAHVEDFMQKLRNSSWTGAGLERYERLRQKVDEVQRNSMYRTVE